MYDRFAGQKIDINGEERVLVREKNILGILPPAPERPQEELPPLMLPAATSTDSSTALAKRTSTSVAVKKETPKPVVKKAEKKEGPRGKGQGKPATKAKKTAAKKAAAKPKKAASKKTAAKKPKKKR
jgi:hypothetical protein